MQALPAVQNIPQSQDNSSQPSSASSNGSGTDFKTMLQSSSANAAKSTDPGKDPKADKSADKKDNSAQENAGQQPILPAAPILSGHNPEKISAKGEKKADSKKDAKPATDALPGAVLSGNISLQTDTAKKLPGKASASDTAAKSSPVENALRKSLVQGQAKDGAKPADIAQTGNNLPPKQIKVSFSQTMTEKPGLPQTKKASENQISLQPAAISQEAKSVPHLTVNAPVASPQWGNELGQKVAWMSASGNHVAELHLNPPNLGPLEVKLTVHNDQATIQFISQHHEVRTALESALPKLREMMMDSGISLGNASVNSGSSQQSESGQQEERQRQQHSVFPVAGSPTRMSRSIVNIGNIDTFA